MTFFNKGTHQNRDKGLDVLFAETADGEADEAEVVVAGFFDERPYTYKALNKPAAGKTLSSKGARFDTLKYDFDLPKTEQIFDLLVKDK